MTNLTDTLKHDVHTSWASIYSITRVAVIWPRRRRRLFQKSCIDFTIQARPLERYMPKDRNSMKYKIWRLVVSTPFEYFIMILIVLNTLLLMMKVSLDRVFGSVLYSYTLVSKINGFFFFFLIVWCTVKIVMTH